MGEQQGMGFITGRLNCRLLEMFFCRNDIQCAYGMMIISQAKSGEGSFWVRWREWLVPMLRILDFVNVKCIRVMSAAVVNYPQGFRGSVYTAVYL